MPNFDPETGAITEEGREALGSIQMNAGRYTPRTVIDKANDTKTVVTENDHMRGQTIERGDGQMSGVETIIKPKNILEELS